MTLTDRACITVSIFPPLSLPPCLDVHIPPPRAENPHDGRAPSLVPRQHTFPALLLVRRSHRHTHSRTSPPNSSERSAET